MQLHPTHRQRTPYLIHFEGETVTLGQPEFLQEINKLLVAAGVTTRPTFWKQEYLSDEFGQFPELITTGVNTFGAPDEDGVLNSVGASLSREDFWAALEKGVFLATSWPVGNAPLFVPELPQWLQNARAWEFDPVLPSDGVGGIGGWARLQGREGSGQPVGLFQLTAPDSFWALGSADDLDGVMNLCRELASVRTGFEKATGFIGEDGRYHCLALPIECQQALEEELFVAGVDTETLLWEE